MDLSDFANLEELDCSDNQLTQIEITNCFNLKTLWCFNNQLTELNVKGSPNLNTINCPNNFLTNLDLNQNGKLEYLEIKDNNFKEQDLTFLTHLVNLKELYLGNYSQERINKGICNRFTGSLEFLKNMPKLELLNIANTDLEKGLEYLPESVRYFYCSVDKKPEAKCQAIYNLFADGQG